MSVFLRPVSEGRPKYVIVLSKYRVIYSVFNFNFNFILEGLS
jgi:hypothetical protein